MKASRARSLLFFVLLFAVAALALDASYGQGHGSGGQQKRVGEAVPSHGLYGHPVTTADDRERYHERLADTQSDREWSRMLAHQ